MLNPEFVTILRVVKGLGLSCTFSTNGFRVRDFKPGDLDHVTMIMISMSGFSKHSYDLIHGFPFPKIKENIATLVRNIQGAGYAGEFRLVPHIYRHNIHEMDALARFAADLEIEFCPTFAFLNSHTLFLQYCENTMPNDILKKAKEMLFLPDPELIKNFPRPANYECRQFRSLVISHHGWLSIGCCSSFYNGTYAIAPVRDLTRQKIESYLSRDGFRKNHPMCMKCRANNMDFLSHKAEAYAELVVKSEQSCCSNLLAQ